MKGTDMALNAAVTDTKWSPNFSAGRPAGNPNMIVIHHWGVDGQNHQGVVDFLCRANGTSSAHYVASAGRVTQLVHDYDRAWHAGSLGNPRGIGIECRPEMSDGDWATVAGLVAAIRAQWGNLPLKGHRDFMSTDCPGRWYSRLGALDAAARGTSAPSAPAASAGIDEDGSWGPATTGLAQTVLGTPVDRVVSGQPPANRSVILTAAWAGSGWEWVTRRGGSRLIARMQQIMQANGQYGGAIDGWAGPGFARGICLRFNGQPDGKLDRFSRAVRGMQAALNQGRF
jgi:hypothetical protein